MKHRVRDVHVVQYDEWVPAIRGIKSIEGKRLFASSGRRRRHIVDARAAFAGRCGRRVRRSRSRTRGGNLRRFGFRGRARAEDRYGGDVGAGDDGDGARVSDDATRDADSRGVDAVVVVVAVGGGGVR